MRILRPGTVVGPQQQYLYLKQLEFTKWAAMDELKKAHTAAVTRPLAPIVTPATPPAETDEDSDIAMRTTPPRPAMQLPPVTPSRHVAAAAAKAKAITPPGQPRKTPNAKRVAQDSDEEDEDESADILPALGVAPSARRVKPVPSRGITASDQRPSRVTRSTANATNIRKAGTAAPESPVKSSRQGPNKIPRLATTKTTSAAKALAAAAVGQTRPPPPTRPLRSNANPPPPTPSRLPTLIPSKRPHHIQNSSSLTDVANLKRTGATKSGDWVANNAAAVVVPASKSERPGLRSVRRRRSSFSAADVVA